MRTYNIVNKLISISRQKILSDKWLIEECDKTKLSLLNIEKTKNSKFGDYYTNIFMIIGLDKEQVIFFANRYIKKMAQKKKIFKKIEFVEPGFVNFTLNTEYLYKQIKYINKLKTKYGSYKKKKLFYNLEYVSANPTGLIHIGHARNAAYGKTLCNVWKKYGIKVNTEYYINDAGNQMEILAYSVFIRYLQAFGSNVQLPQDYYNGNEIIWIATEIKNKVGKEFVDKPYNSTKILDKETAAYFREFARNYLLSLISETLKDFGVEFDIWFSEKKLYSSNIINEVINSLKPYTYTSDGALFLKTTDFGDDLDRVIVKKDGTYTYFLPDIAYHLIKINRGYSHIFNIWGADHKSYVERMTIALKMLRHDNIMTVFIQQMVRLVKDGEEYKMSKRSGISLTTQDMIDGIGKDSARWFLIINALSTHLDIDVDKATKKDSNNSLYYVQYAYARICQILDKAKNILNEAIKNDNFDLLVSNSEREITNELSYFPVLISSVATKYEVHKIPAYLINLAKLFHSYYGSVKIVDLENNKELSVQRLSLVIAIKNIIFNGLALVDIVPPEKM